MNSEKFEQLGGLRVDDVTGRTVTEEDVRRVEQHIGAELPEDYRAFLLQYGSGRMYFGEAVAFPVQTYPGGACGIDAFFGAVPLKNSRDYDLVSHYDMTRVELPRYVLPIAGDGGGDYVCLALAGENAGRIYFWCHEEYLVEDEPTYTYMEYVASSFRDFVSKLELYEYEEAGE